MPYTFRISSSISDGGPAISTQFNVDCEGKDGLDTVVTQGTNRTIPLTIPIANIDVFYAVCDQDCTVLFKNAAGNTVKTWNAKANKAFYWEEESGFDLPFTDGIGSTLDDIVEINVAVPAGTDCKVKVVFGTNSV